MTQQLHGSCFCKAVHYQLDSLDMPISHCHCDSCRKVHAAAFVATAGVMREHFRWTQGQEWLAPSNRRRANFGISARAAAHT